MEAESSAISFSEWDLMQEIVLPAVNRTASFPIDLPALGQFTRLGSGPILCFSAGQATNWPSNSQLFKEKPRPSSGKVLQLRELEDTYELSTVELVLRGNRLKAT